MLEQIDADLRFGVGNRGGSFRRGGFLLDEEVGKPARRERTARIDRKSALVSDTGLLEPCRTAMQAGQPHKAVTDAMAVVKVTARLDQRLPGLDVVRIAAEVLLEKLRGSLRRPVPDARERLRDGRRLGRLGSGFLALDLDEKFLLILGIDEPGKPIILKIDFDGIFLRRRRRRGRWWWWCNRGRRRLDFRRRRLGLQLLQTLELRPRRPG